MHNLIKTLYMNKSSQHGLPVVLAAHEVSCKSQGSDSMERLRESIYKTAVNLQLDKGGKGMYVHQQINRVLNSDMDRFQ